MGNIFRFNLWGLCCLYWGSQVCTYTVQVLEKIRRTVAGLILMSSYLFLSHWPGSECAQAGTQHWRCSPCRRGGGEEETEERYDWLTLGLFRRRRGDQVWFHAAEGFSQTQSVESEACLWCHHERDLFSRSFFDYHTSCDLLWCHGLCIKTRARLNRLWQNHVLSFPENPSWMER